MSANLNDDPLNISAFAPPPEVDPNREALKDPRIRTFLDKISKAEGADYNTLVGGRKIADLSKHPNIVGLTTPAGPSTAFGRYQITGSTDRSKLAKYRHLDYSPENQDLRAVELLRQTKALDALQQGDEATAIKRAGREWASFPGSSLPGRKNPSAFATAVNQPSNQDPLGIGQFAQAAPTTPTVAPEVTELAQAATSKPTRLPASVPSASPEVAELAATITPPALGAVVKHADRISDITHKYQRMAGGEAPDQAAQPVNLTASDAAWHFGMTPSQVKRLTRRQYRVLADAVLEDKRKRDAGQQIQPPTLKHQNDTRVKAGLKPLELNVAADENAVSPYYQPTGGNLPNLTPPASTTLRNMPGYNPRTGQVEAREVPYWEKTRPGQLSSAQMQEEMTRDPTAILKQPEFMVAHDQPSEAQQIINERIAGRGTIATALAQQWPKFVAHTDLIGSKLAKLAGKVVQLPDVSDGSVIQQSVADYLEKRSAMWNEVAQYGPPKITWPQKTIRAAINAGYDVARISATVEATGLSLPTVMVGESLVLNSDKDFDTQQKEAAKAFAFGWALSKLPVYAQRGVGQIPGLVGKTAVAHPEIVARTIGALGFGGLGAGEAYARGASKSDIAAEAVAMGVVGGGLAGGGLKRIGEAVRAIPDAAIRAEWVPVNVRDAVARSKGYEPVVVADGEGNYAAAYLDPKAKRGAHYEIIDEAQANKMADKRRFVGVEPEQFVRAFGTKVSEATSAAPAEAVPMKRQIAETSKPAKTTAVKTPAEPPPTEAAPKAVASTPSEQSVAILEAKLQDMKSGEFPTDDPSARAAAISDVRKALEVARQQAAATTEDLPNDVLDAIAAIKLRNPVSNVIAWRQFMIDGGYPKADVDNAIRESAKTGIDPARSQDLHDLDEYMTENLENPEFRAREARVGNVLPAESKNTPAQRWAGIPEHLLTDTGKEFVNFREAVKDVPEDVMDQGYQALFNRLKKHLEKEMFPTQNVPTALTGESWFSRQMRDAYLKGDIHKWEDIKAFAESPPKGAFRGRSIVKSTVPVEPLVREGEKPPPVPEGHTRFFRADHVDATEPLGSGWAPRDPEYVSQKYGKGQMGSETIWYRDVPNSEIDAEYHDHRAVSILNADALDRMKGSEPKLYRRVQPSPQVEAQTETPVDVAAHGAAHSPRNELTEPTEAQAEAGNYRKGHARVAGLNLSIEIPEGGERSGVDNGKPWSVKMKSHYGYIRGYQEGADGEHVDAFVKPGTQPDYSGPIFVVNQKNKAGRLDEHKVMIGWADEASAKQGYLENYEPGWKGFKSMATFADPSSLREWLDSGDLQKVAETPEGTNAITAGQEPSGREPKHPRVAHGPDLRAHGGEVREAPSGQASSGDRVEPSAEESGVRSSETAPPDEARLKEGAKEGKTSVETTEPSKGAVAAPDQKTGDFATRITDIAKARDAAGLQTLLAEMEAHRSANGGNARLSRLITSARAALRPKPEPVKPPGPPTKADRLTMTRSEYVNAVMRHLEPGRDAVIAMKNAKRDHDYSVRKAVREGQFPTSDPDKAIAVLKSLGKTVPSYIKQQIARIEGSAYDVGKKYTGPAVGRPRSNPETSSLEKEIRALGGVKADKDGANRGEVEALRLSGKRGLVDPNGKSVEQMATALAEEGYGRGVWWEGEYVTDVNPDAFLQAASDDAAGSTRHYSDQYNPDTEHPDVKAFDDLSADAYGKELIDLIGSGHARASDIAELTREAKKFGLSDEALAAFLDSVSTEIKNDLPEEVEGTETTTTGEGYSLDADGTLLDPDGQPLFSRAQQLQFVDEGLTQESAQPRSTDQREALAQAERDRQEAANPERTAAMKTLAEIRRRGMTVDEYARQGALFGPTPSDAEIKLLKELERPVHVAKTETQESMFAKGWETAESGPAYPPMFSVEENRVVLENSEASQLLTKAFTEMGHPNAKSKTGIGGAFVHDARGLVKQLRGMSDEGAASLADAVQKAAKHNKVLLAFGKSAMRHEMFHETSANANQYLEQRHADLPGLVAHPVFEKIRHALTVEMNYPGHNGTLVEEGAAYIAQGEYKRLGLTREEAIDWMDAWFTSFAKKNPNVTLKQFRELSDEATKAREAVYAKGAASAKAESDVQGVDRGRTSGVSESAATRAGPAGEASTEGLAARGEPVKQTGTPAFKKWFGKSKVVDPDGNPLVVYHANATDSPVFDIAKQRFGVGGYGFYFSNAAGANRYAEHIKVEKIPAISDQTNVTPVYLALENPLIVDDVKRLRNLLEYGQTFGAQRGYSGNISPEKVSALQRQGYDGVIATESLRPNLNKDGSLSHSDKANKKTYPLYIAFEPTQIKSAIGNSGQFDSADPNILMARGDDPWADLEDDARSVLKPKGEKERSLPKNLADAQLPSGDDTTYQQQSFDEGEDIGRQMVAEKGVDGTIEHVLHGAPGIGWGPAGFAALDAMQSEERTLRQSDPAKADELQAKIDKFAGEFSARATELGRAVVSINIIERFAPDRAAYELNRAKLKGQKKAASQAERERFHKWAMDLQKENDALKANDRMLVEKQKSKPKRTSKAKKTDYQSKLDEEAKAILDSLKPKMGHFDFGNLKTSAGRFPGQAGAVGEDKMLPGDAEPLAQYAASQLAVFDTAAELNEHLLSEFGQELAPYLPAIRQRAFQIRQSARLAELEAKDTTKVRRRTILSEIQKEISTAAQEARVWERYVAQGKTKAEREAAIRVAQVEAEWRRVEASNTKATEKAARLAELANKRADAHEAQSTAKAKATADRATKLAEEKRLTRDQRIAARHQAKVARDREAQEVADLKREARERAKRVREELAEARKAELKGYRESVKARNEAARKAGLWDAPLRDEAVAARVRLQTATNPKDPDVMRDLVSVAIERFLPDERSAAVRTKAVEPAAFYVDLKKEFPNLVSRRNQRKIYKQAWERIEDVKAVAREAARLRSAHEESDKLWEQGVDVEEQAILIRRAEHKARQEEIRGKMAAELARVSQSVTGKIISAVFLKSNGFMRAMMSSIDAPLGRQGLYPILTHPIRSLRAALPATGRGYGALKRSDMDALEADIKEHPRWKMAKDLGLDLTEVGGGGKDPLIHAEEQFGSPLAMKFPHVRLSEQGYTAGMNAIRLDFFDIFATALEADGYTVEDNREDFEDAVGLVNKGTGRGDLPEWAKQATKFSNTVFFAARFGVSHFQLLNDLFNPVKYIPARFNPASEIPGFKSYGPTLRKSQMKQLIRLGFMFAALYGLAKLAGFDVSQFPIIRLGNSRYDLSGGKVSAIKQIMKLAEAVDAAAHGRPSKDIFMEAAHFGRGKLSPLASAVPDAYYGKSVTGQPVNFKIQAPVKMMQENIALQRVMPIIFGDFADAYADDGWMGILKSSPGVTGLNVNTYPDSAFQLVQDIKKVHASVMKEMDRLRGPGFTGDIKPPEQAKGEDDSFYKKRAQAETEAALKSLDDTITQPYYRELTTREQKQRVIRAVVKGARAQARSDLGFVPPPRAEETLDTP